MVTKLRQKWRSFGKDRSVLGQFLVPCTRAASREKKDDCFGMRGDRVTALLPQILEEFSSYVGNGKRFTSFAVVAHRHARDCPLNPCPFHPER